MTSNQIVESQLKILGGEKLFFSLSFRVSGVLRFLWETAERNISAFETQ